MVFESYFKQNNSSIENISRLPARFVKIMTPVKPKHHVNASWYFWHIISLNTCTIQVKCLKTSATDTKFDKKSFLPFEKNENTIVTIWELSMPKRSCKKTCGSMHWFVYTRFMFSPSELPMLLLKTPHKYNRWGTVFLPSAISLNQ